ncbi:GspE/PulE family protein [Niabella drilacis]|uniref:Type IV pilus assembly protein PilB n=1 Tax=Niabella drilacis (strain DSM 25811 / CCM 8410 / CCUG 62505 / LMG 26954 / E90) TaxID=1285928 RepID=A0A1G6URM5_NIADE|nr:GspE/PulE family protein [Niabella drilacis]SDD43215.1 type IV pilus assembly protein PilB [Niabella drilacis]
MNTTADISKLITPELAWKYHTAFAGFENGVLLLWADAAAAETELDRHREELEWITGYPVRFEKLDTAALTQKISAAYAKKDTTDQRGQHNFYTGHPDHFLNDLIAEAKSLKSSDIHIETYEHDCRVRIRVDGLLVLRYLIEKKQYPALINKIKISANLDIAEKRLPQDGRIFFQKGIDKFDIRVSIVPTLHGEKVVLRLLSNDATDIRLETLGFSDNDLDNYLEGLKKPYGIVLISGPTGSGKTTTLYATLKLLNLSTRNILTIEDPIEYTLKGINQVQVKENIGLSFSVALRTFLRQDPDVIMLGEIRDAETANMAIRAALTGHLVLSTIHTNSAWGTVSRLIDMNIPSFLIANTLNTSVAQRLVRLLCPDCKREAPFLPAFFPKNYRPPQVLQTHWVPGGCSHCYNTGYRRRKAIYEVIPVDAELADKIKKGSSRVDELLKTKQIKTLADNAFELLKTGETSLEEVYPMLLN